MRQLSDHLIFIIGIHKPGKMVFISNLSTPKGVLYSRWHSPSLLSSLLLTIPPSLCPSLAPYSLSIVGQYPLPYSHSHVNNDTNIYSSNITSCKTRLFSSQYPGVSESAKHDHQVHVCVTQPLSDPVPFDATVGDVTAIDGTGGLSHITDHCPCPIRVINVWPHSTFK